MQRRASRSAWPPAVLAGLALAGCTHRRPPPVPPPPVTYVLEPAWQTGGIWYYPHETFSLDATGLAAVLPPTHPARTTDQEPYDPAAMAAAMQDVQLPAIASVTNLETGRQVLLRVNDRGPADPGRLIAVTPRVAALLGFVPGQPARVRLRFDPELSAALARQVRGTAGDIAIATAPQAGVQQAELAPLAGTSQEAARAVRATAGVTQAGAAAAVIVPSRLPATVVQAPVEPGLLMIDAGRFDYEGSARRRVAALGEPDARLQRVRRGRSTSYIVRTGPYADSRNADSALARIIAGGITDARIVVDPQ